METAFSNLLFEHFASGSIRQHKTLSEWVMLLKLPAVHSMFKTTFEPILTIDKDKIYNETILRDYPKWPEVCALDIINVDPRSIVDDTLHLLELPKVWDIAFDSTASTPTFAHLFQRAHDSLVFAEERFKEHATPDRVFTSVRTLAALNVLHCKSLPPAITTVYTSHMNIWLADLLVKTYLWTPKVYTRCKYFINTIRHNIPYTMTRHITACENAGHTELCQRLHQALTYAEMIPLPRTK